VISSLQIGAEFLVRDLASPELAKIADSLKLLDDQINKTKQSLIGEERGR
jgi:hypothetical protein